MEGNLVDNSSKKLTDSVLKVFELPSSIFEIVDLIFFLPSLITVANGDFTQRNFLNNLTKLTDFKVERKIFSHIILGLTNMDCSSETYTI